MGIREYLLEKNEMELFCDMDGVIVHFIDGANKVSELNGYGNNWEKLAKKDLKTAWKIINEVGSDFWTNLNWMKDGKNLWKSIKKYNPTILSAYPYSTEDPKVKYDAIIGKKKWLGKNINSDIENKAIICARNEKVKFANKNHILIDDSEKNIKEWERAGGIGILHKSTNSTVKKLKNIME